MAVRLFENREHATAYLHYRMTPDEIVSIVMSYVKKRIQRPLNLALDVGCGSGQGTVLLAQHFSSVVGTDISPAQLESAGAHQDYYPNVTYRYGHVGKGYPLLGEKPAVKGTNPGDGRAA